MREFKSRSVCVCLLVGVVHIIDYIVLPLFTFCTSEQEEKNIIVLLYGYGISEAL